MNTIIQLLDNFYEFGSKNNLIQQQINNIFKGYQYIISENSFKVYLIPPGVKDKYIQLISDTKFIPINKNERTGIINNYTQLPKNNTEVSVGVFEGDNSHITFISKMELKIKQKIKLYLDTFNNVNINENELYNIIHNLSYHTVMCFRAPCPPIFDEKEFINNIYKLLVILNHETHGYIKNITHVKDILINKNFDNFYNVQVSEEDLLNVKKLLETNDEYENNDKFKHAKHTPNGYYYE